MREFRSYGSVRGVLGNRHPYRDPFCAGAGGFGCKAEIWPDETNSENRRCNWIYLVTVAAFD
jgi:hypothetical protein